MHRPYVHDGRVRADIVQHLRCPVCGDPLNAGDRALHCPDRHSFDLARQGYVDLTAGRVTHAGDSTEMISARAALLGAGHFRVLEQGLTGAAGDHPPGLVVDIGAGTGHYLAAVLDAFPDDLGLAVDVSKPALRRAAKAHQRLAAVRADAWRRLPVADGAASAVLNVFAPRDGAEFRRIMRPDGLLVVATPAADHLGELVSALDLVRVDPDKAGRLAATLTPWFVPAGGERHRWRLRLTAQEVRTVVAMGPSARHTDPARLETISMEVTADVDVTRWRPRP
jgi:23S rRNA (guanine745-N1)-methyltransferase